MKQIHIQKTCLGICLTDVGGVCCCAGAPISKGRKVVKTPNQYVNNCYGEEYKMKGKEYKKKRLGSWVVYSDRADNPTYQTAGGVIEMVKADFMDPFIVIKHKGNYVQLIKHDPKVATIGKIADPKSIEYVGWMPKSHLLLTRQSYTDVESNMKTKYVTAFKDTTIIFSPTKFMKSKDSLVVFSDANLTQPKGNTPLYEVVYRLKRSEDNRKSLISKLQTLPADSVKENVIGWIDNAMLVNIGQQLHMSIDENKSGVVVKDERGRDGASLISGQRENFVTRNAHKARALHPLYKLYEYID